MLPEAHCAGGVWSTPADPPPDDPPPDVDVDPPPEVEVDPPPDVELPPDVEVDPEPPPDGPEASAGADRSANASPKLQTAAVSVGTFMFPPSFRQRTRL